MYNYYIINKDEYEMKKVISLILTLILMLIPSSTVFAKPSNDSSSTKPPKDFSSLVLVNTKTYTVDGIEYVEYYYKPSSKVSVQAKNNLSIAPMALVPDEGDFDIVISKGTLSGKDWFSTVTGYYNYLSTTGCFVAADIASGFKSLPILSYFTSAAINLIHNGLKGSGTAYSVQRTVTKWGQIYHHGSWVDYYHGTQKEVFWGEKTFVYPADGTVVSTLNKDYLENSGYKPIYVNATSIFRDNSKVYQYALAQYESNSYWYGDTGSVIVKTSDWATGINPMY